MWPISNWLFKNRELTTNRKRQRNHASPTEPTIGARSSSRLEQTALVINILLSVLTTWPPSRRICRGCPKVKVGSSSKPTPKLIPRIANQSYKVGTNSPTGKWRLLVSGNHLSAYIWVYERPIWMKGMETKPPKPASLKCIVGMRPVHCLLRGLPMRPCNSIPCGRSL